MFSVLPITVVFVIIIIMMMMMMMMIIIIIINQELANEICAMWKQNAVKVILIVIESMGVIPKSLSQSLK